MREPKEVKNHRRLIRLAAAVVSAFALVLVCAVPALAADSWTDITDTQWAQTYGITAAQVATVAQGYDDGTFRPTQTVTRAQYAKMVLSALGSPRPHLRARPSQTSPLPATTTRG